MMLYTPSPWTRGSLLNNQILIHDESREYVLGVLYGVGRGSSGTTVDLPLLANARLVIAAPEMLDALVMIRDADNHCRMEGLGTIPMTSRTALDRVIAKAGGSTKLPRR